MYTVLILQVLMFTIKNTPSLPVHKITTNYHLYYYLQTFLISQFKSPERTNIRVKNLQKFYHSEKGQEKQQKTPLNNIFNINQDIANTKLQRFRTLIHLKDSNT
eukprot:EC096914.1.p2 GENE.EC096914.1~~EC096914.1.p2  ORF type:complete len:104 (-),score=5.43 EC096914.1:324-635(-)